MPFLYVYSPSDFVTPPPAEVGAQAAGTGPFTLTLAPGATPTLIEVTDNDTVFDEIDTSQVLTNAVNIDGTSIAANTTIHTAYDLINTTTGHKITSLHFGGDGYQQGTVDGIVSTVALTPGTSYTFDLERTSHQQDNGYADFVACFTAHTRIQTDRGLVKARDLVAGDKVQTLDNGLQTLRMVLSRALPSEHLQQHPNMRPVCIKAGAISAGVPGNDLFVSPQHRFLVQSPVATRMFGASEVLVSAKKMTELPGIFVDQSMEPVEYFHLVLDNHEIICAEGALTESFFLGPYALDAFDAETRAELVTLFPELLSQDFVPSQARPIPSNREQAKLIWRHQKNAKALCEKNMQSSFTGEAATA